MFRLAIVFALVVSTVTQDLLGVNYSFDVDFYTNFDTKRCDGDNDMWELVSYGALDIESPFTGGDRAIQSVGESCASSFPIVFVGGTLEVKIYARVFSHFFKLSIELFDEDDMCITSYVYRGSNEDFIPGWRILSLNIEKHFQGYIHLRGRSLKNEILLIDSFCYIPNGTISWEDKRKKRSLEHENKDENEIIFQYKVHNNQYDDESLEGSGDSGIGTESPPSTDQPVVEEPQERNTFWNPFTIALVSFGTLVVVALFVVGAYHYGKVRAMRIDPLTLDDVEPSPTITIPRATGRPNRINRSRYYDF